MGTRADNSEQIYDLSQVIDPKNKQVGQSAAYLHRAAEPGRARVALIDSFAFTRDCLVETAEAQQRGLTFSVFDSVDQFTVAGVPDLDVILYYNHDERLADILATTAQLRCRDGFPDVPVIVLTDATVGLEVQTIKAALKSGVRGFMSARTIEMKTVVAAILLVVAGGTFAPIDLLLAGGEDRTNLQPPTAPSPELLTPRQLTVLTHMQQGKANKIIAYELGMSESTVKVHVRNIMRKTGATNRTQALYKLQQIANAKTTVGYAQA